VLIGAALAFFATQYQERISWRRRKAEQMRDRQFTSLGDAAKRLDALARTVKEISTQIQERAKQMVAPAAALDVLNAETRVTAGAWLEHCRREQVELGLALLEMRVLRMRGSAVDVAEEAYKKGSAVVSVLQGITVADSHLLPGAVAALSTELSELATQFASVALDSVSGEGPDVGSKG
jgi:hypothetical protein